MRKHLFEKFISIIKNKYAGIILELANYILILNLFLSYHGEK